MLGFVQVLMLLVALTLSLVIPQVYSAAPDSSVTSSDPDLCLKIRGQQARATSQKELDSLPTPAQCLPSKGETSPSTTTAETSNRKTTTIPGFGGRLFYEDEVPALLNFREQLQMGQIIWKCDADGNMVIESNPNREITVQSVLKNLVKPDPRSMFSLGFHSGYEYGIKAAQNDLKHVFKSECVTDPDFHDGFDEGYHQGYDAYVVIKRTQAYEDLER